MAQRIYKLWQTRFTEAWHQLSGDEQTRLFGQVQEALSTAGGKEVVVCDAAWSNEEWPYFGLEEFPDADAVRRHQQILADLGWPRYVESRSFLGTHLVLPAP